MPAPSPPIIRIDIVSDVVCPWCIVGYKQLEQALSETGLQAQIQWHPFELNPDMPAEGQDLRAHITEKYGSTREDSQRARDRLTALGDDLGFAFRFSDNSRMLNTFRAHQLIEWAAAQRRQTDMKLALFKAYFSDARDVSDLDTLAAIADELGLDASDALTALRDGRHASEVRVMQNFWTGKGIRGVPAMVFNLEHLLTGAQGKEAYAQLLKKCAANTVG